MFEDSKTFALSIITADSDLFRRPGAEAGCFLSSMRVTAQRRAVTPCPGRLNGQLGLGKRCSDADSDRDSNSRVGRSQAAAAGGECPSHLHGDALTDHGPVGFVSPGRARASGAGILDTTWTSSAAPALLFKFASKALN